MLFQFVSEKIKSIDCKWGIIKSAIIFSIFLHLLACLYVTPALTVINHGTGYANLSIAPIDLSYNSAFRFRILSPAIAHLLFLRGKLFIFFPLLVSLIFVSTIYVVCRKRFNLNANLSFITASIICFSTPLLFLLHFQGYVDVFSYFFIFLCLISKRFIFQSLFFALAILNHESSIFAFPFLVFRPWENSKINKVFFVRLGCYLLSLAPMILYRIFLSQYTEVALNSSFYLSLKHVKFCLTSIAQLAPIGIFESFRLFWFIPLVTVIFLFKNDRKLNAYWYILVFACSISQLFIAHDTSRVLGLAFPIFIFSIRDLSSFFTNEKLEKMLFIIFFLNFLVPVYYVGQNNMIPFLPLPVSLVLLFFGFDPWSLWWTHVNL